MIRKLIYILIFLSLSGYAEETNLARNCLVNCSNGNNPEFAVDGNRSGWFWESSLFPSPCWLEIDLGKAYKINEIRLFMWWGDKRYYQYFIETSPDRKDWKEVVDERKNTVSSNPEGRKYEINPAVNVRFIRLTVTGNSINQGAHVREIEIYGE